jgi:hypothetical protein
LVKEINKFIPQTDDYIYSKVHYYNNSKDRNGEKTSFEIKNIIGFNNYDQDFNNFTRSDAIYLNRNSKVFMSCFDLISHSVNENLIYVPYTLDEFKGNALLRYRLYVLMTRAKVSTVLYCPDDELFNHFNRKLNELELTSEEEIDFLLQNENIQREKICWLISYTYGTTKADMELLQIKDEKKHFESITKK